MKNILITGCNRGIGLALAKYYLEAGDKVYGTVRNLEIKAEMEEIFKNQSNFTAFVLDLESQEDLINTSEAIIKSVSSLDIFIQNAGVSPATLMPESSISKLKLISELDSLALERINRINAIQPIIFTTKLLPLLRKRQNPKISFISSIAGSISNKKQGSAYGYSGSKALLNMYSKLLALDLYSENITVVVIHPGLVQTRMGRINSDLTADQSAEYISTTINRLNINLTGSFLNFDGSEIDW